MACSLGSESSRFQKLETPNHSVKDRSLMAKFQSKLSRVLPSSPKPGNGTFKGLFKCSKEKVKKNQEDGETIAKWTNDLRSILRIGAAEETSDNDCFLQSDDELTDECQDVDQNKEEMCSASESMDVDVAETEPISDDTETNFQQLESFMEQVEKCLKEEKRRNRPKMTSPQSDEKTWLPLITSEYVCSGMNQTERTLVPWQSDNKRRSGCLQIDIPSDDSLLSEFDSKELSKGDSLLSTCQDLNGACHFDSKTTDVTKADLDSNVKGPYSNASGPHYIRNVFELLDVAESWRNELKNRSIS